MSTDRDFVQQKFRGAVVECSAEQTRYRVVTPGKVGLILSGWCLTPEAAWKRASERLRREGAR